MKEFLSICKTYWRTITNIVALFMKIVIFFYLIIAFHLGNTKLLDLVAVLVAAGIIIAVKSNQNTK